jgi:hypothetical protein
MSLQTFEDEEILARVRRLEKKVDRLFELCEEILENLEPHYRPPIAIEVIPAKFD